MEVKHKSERGGKGGERVVVSFGPLDDVKEEMLEPIWSDLDVFSNGDLNGLLSSDIHDGEAAAEIDAEGHGHVLDHVVYPQETGGFRLLKVKEEFPVKGDHEMLDAPVAKLVPVPTILENLGDAEVTNSGVAKFRVEDKGSDAEAARLGEVAYTHEHLGVQCSDGMNAEVVSLVDVVDIDDNSGVRDSHKGITEVHFGLDGIHGVSGVPWSGRKTKEEVMHEEQDQGLVGAISENRNLHGVQGSQNQEDEIHDRAVNVLEILGAQQVTLTPEEVDQEMLCVENAKKLVTKQEIDQVQLDARFGGIAKADNEETCAQCSEDDEDDEEIDHEQALAVVDSELLKTAPGFVSGMLRDGTLSAEGLASKGFFLADDGESDSDEDVDSDSSSDDEEDAESDEESSCAGSDDDDEESEAKTIRKGKEEIKDSEDTIPARTKHELDVLPPVPKVTAVLEPHHKTVFVGHILSVLDLKIIVEASNSEQRILNENSIVWLTESRLPLGIVDEVFGPVKNPFYLVRFNELSEIPEDAKAGAAVSYVSEFSEFVLKDNPNLYRKAVDASGLDDEELGSDEDLEFSDDEKEAAARQREKSKRGLNKHENKPGQAWNSAEVQHPKGHRTERGRGRGRGGGRGASMSNAVDSAADVVAGMDLRGLPGGKRLQRPGSKQQQNRRSWNQGRQSSPQKLGGHQEVWASGSGTAPVNRYISSPKHQGSGQNRDGTYFDEQPNSQIQSGAQAAPQAYQTGAGVRGIPFNEGAVPAQLQGQGISRQQLTNGFQPFGYNNVPSYDAQFAVPGYGNMYARPGGPQFIQNPGVFNAPGLHPNPFFNVQGQGQMGLVHGARYDSSAHEAQMNYGGPVHRSIGEGQAGGHPSYTGFMAPPPTFGSGMVAPDYRTQSMLQNIQGPAGVGRASYDGRRGPPSGNHQRSYSNKKGYQG